MGGVRGWQRDAVGGREGWTVLPGSRWAFRLESVSCKYLAFRCALV